jgi:hypothetical protein
MTISGTWAAQAQVPYADPQHGTLPEPDPDHNRKDAAIQNPSWGAPSYAVGNGAITSDPQAPSVVGLEAFNLPMPVPVIDRTPEGHAISESHSADHGADDKNVYFPEAYQFFNEHYYGYDLEANGPTPIVAKAGNATPWLRGINSSPTNNPPVNSYAGRGWRQGHYIGSNINRRFAPQRRQHDYRFVRPDVVTIIADAPPPTKPTRYGPVYSSLQRFKTDIKSRPMQRRQPPPFDEDLLYDGTNAAPQAPVDSGGW